MDEALHETTPLLRAEEVDKVEVYPIIHQIKTDIIVSCLVFRTLLLANSESCTIALHRYVTYSSSLKIY
jgi:hypothetical protein